MAEKKKTGKKYIVVFQDEENTVLKTAFMAEGDGAQPPEISAKKGETAHHEVVFAGWDTDFSRVEKNLVVKAIYKEIPKKYLVMYFHENDRLLGMESVSYGQAAKAEVFPEKEGDAEYEYPFLGWNRPLDHIEKDTNVKAVFGRKRRVFSVRFLHEDGNLLKEEQVEYGSPAHPPEAPVKAADAVYHYAFAVWSAQTERITENVDISAVFSYIYNEYTVAFYDGEELVQEKKYHYGDLLLYPERKKRGYELRWSRHPERVTESLTLHACWTFANPAGKRIAAGTGLFQIMNPSVKNGSVRCLLWREPEKIHISLPENVKLGDYYYRIECIGAFAFQECQRMEKLTLPDSLRVVEEKGLAGCLRLRDVHFGTQLRLLGADAFAGDIRLRTLTFSGTQLRQCHGRAFHRLSSAVKVRLPLACLDQYERLFGAGLTRGIVVIKR